MNEEVLNVARY